MKVFTVYRPNAPESHGALRKNAPDQPQFEGVVFDSGKCVIHWLTSAKSVSVFDSYEQMWQIHGHPEYGTIVRWQDKE
jgi:hypothetical protein